MSRDQYSLLTINFVSLLSLMEICHTLNTLLEYWSHAKTLCTMEHFCFASLCKHSDHAFTRYNKLPLASIVRQEPWFNILVSPLKKKHSGILNGICQCPFVPMLSVSTVDISPISADIIRLISYRLPQYPTRYCQYNLPIFKTIILTNTTCFLTMLLTTRIM